MAIVTTTRAASMDELAAEMDRRGEVIDRLQAEIEVLKNGAHAGGNLGLLYKIREAMGWNDKCGLSDMPYGIKRIVDALDRLERAAAEVDKYGASTGPQWTRLASALIHARSELSMFRSRAALASQQDGGTK